MALMAGYFSSLYFCFPGSHQDGAKNIQHGRAYPHHGHTLKRGVFHILSPDPRMSFGVITTEYFMKEETGDH